MSRSRATCLVLVLVVLLIASYHDAKILFRYPIAVGMTGYYYLIEVDSLRDQGRLHFPTTTPLLFYGFNLLRLLFRDSLLSIKVGSLLINALTCLGICAIIITLTRSWWLGLLALALSAFAPLHLFLLMEYHKQACALFLMIWGSWAAIRFFQTRGVKWLVLAVALMCGAALSHKSGLPTIILIAGMALLAAPLTSPGEKRWKRIVALEVIVLIWVTPLVLTWQSIWQLPFFLSRELSVSPSWPLQALAVSEGLLLIFLAPAVLVVLTITAPDKLPPRYVRVTFAVVAIWSLLITVHPFLNSDPRALTITGRLGFQSYLQVAILLPAFFWLIRSNKRLTGPYFAAALLPIFLFQVRAPSPPGIDENYLKQRDVLVSSLRTFSASKLGQNSLVIAPHGDQFVVTAMTRVPSQQKLPADENGRVIFWLLRQFECTRVQGTSMWLSETGGGRCTVFIENDQLWRLLDSVPDDERRRLLTANPYFRKAHSLIGE